MSHKVTTRHIWPKFNLTVQIVADCQPLTQHANWLKKLCIYNQHDQDLVTLFLFPVDHASLQAPL